MSEILRLKDLTKRFGDLIAVDGLNLSIHSGQVYGILGPNGSGKTTMLGMVLDVVSPTRGQYEWFGGMKGGNARLKIGTILETPCFYNYLTATENLKVVAHIKKCGVDNIDVLLKQVNLYERRHHKFKTYSLGMKQRLAIASALLSAPPVLILDEPTNGLDPEGIAGIRELIMQIAMQGKTIIMASHLLDEVQKVCTHFCILRKGKKLYEGSVNDILGETNVIEIASSDIEKLTHIVNAYHGKRKLIKENGSLFVHLKEGHRPEELNQFCFDKGISLDKLIPQSRSLEQEFLKILKEND